MREPCPLCAGGVADRLWREDGHAAYGCLSCRAVFVRPLPPEHERAALYGPDYFRRFYVRSRPRRLAALGRWLDALAPRLPRPGRLLDIGAGIGLFLEVATARGWDAWGVEPAPAARDLIPEAIRARCWASVEQAGSEPAFDLVTLWDVLAHLPDPPGTLDAIGKLLAPGGALVIKTPYRPPAAFRIAAGVSPLLPTRGLLRVPAQLFHFTPESLGTLLGRHGFALAEWRPVREVRPSVLGGWKDAALAGIRILSTLTGIPQAFIALAQRRGA